MRVVAHAPAEIDLADVEAPEQRVEPRTRRRRRAERREKLQITRAGELRVHRHLAGQVADAAAHLETLAPAVHSEHERRPARRTQQIEQHPDRRRLPRAVGAEESEDFTRHDLERHLLQTDDRSVVLRQAVEADRRVRHVSVLSCGPIRAGRC